MFKDGFIYAVILALNSLIVIASIYILTRLLDNNQYGIYSLGVAAASIVSAAMFQWINISIARLYVINPAALLTEAIKWFVRASILTLLGMSLFLYNRDFIEVNSLLIISIGFGAISLGLFSLFRQVANSQGRPISYGLLSTVRLLASLISGMILITVGFNEEVLLFSLTIGSILALAIVKPPKFKKEENKKIRKEILTYGVPLTLLSISTMVIDFSDRFLIGLIHGPAATAAYSATYDLTQQILGSILSVFSLVFFRKIIIHWEENNIESTTKLINLFFGIVLISAVFLVGILISFKQEIVKLLDSTLQAESEILIPWISAGIAIGIFKGYILDLQFHIEKSTKTQIIIVIAMAVINIVLNLITIPKLGSVGAAISTTLTFSIGAVISWSYLKKSRIYRIPLLEILKGIICLIVMISVSYTIDYSFGNKLSLLHITLKFFILTVAFFISTLSTNFLDIRHKLIAHKP